MKRFKIGIVIVTLVMLVGLVLGTVALAKSPLNVNGSKNNKIWDKYVQDEIIVKFKGDKKPFQVVKVPESKVLEEIEKYKKRVNVEYVEPNYIAHTMFRPNDPYYSYQWHLDNFIYGGIQMEEAWNISTGTGVKMAVIDTGIRKGADLTNTCFVAGYDFVNRDTDPTDDNGHGTHVAGTIAQSTNNALGVAGVAFNSCLMPVKVLGATGSGTYANIALGIRYAADNGAKVINLSLGGPSASTTLEQALVYAYERGVTIVAAAGNDGSSALSYPAAYDAYVIAVGATRYNETLAPYSNYGPSLDLVAPGGDLNVDQNGDGYADGVLQQTFTKSGTRITWGYYFFQGTSMATPHISGVAALLIAKGNATTPDQIRTALQSTAEDKGVAGRDNTYGYGLVNAYAALNWTPGPVDNPPTVSLTSPVDGATVLGLVTIDTDATDDVGVVQVDFYYNSTLIGTDDIFPYSIDWDSTTIADGTYTLIATAIDTIFQSSSDSISVLVDNINDAPIANAGPDQTVSDSDGNGTETVTLNGSTSYDPNGTIVSYEWKEGATILGTTAVITYDFTVGTHTVTLAVTDNSGATSQDTALVEVTEKPAAIICWNGSNQYLYKINSQAKKFCKCASGIYGYNSYVSQILRGAIVYQYIDTGNNENWGVTSRSSNSSVYQVTCTDGEIYPTNVDYTYPR